MCVEMIPAQVSKPVNILRCNQSFAGNDLVAYLQFFKIFFEWMFAISISLCVLLVNSCNSCNTCWRPLYSHSLHIMLDSPDSPHFFTTTGTTGPAMNKHWQWRAVTRAFFSTFCI